MSIEQRVRDSQALDPDDPRVRPADLHLDRKTGLRILWEDGVETRFSLTDLRRNCPCATCRTQRETTPAPAARSLSLTILPQGIERATQVMDASLVGRYALQINWGDGHTTGIYDFRYLRALADSSGNESKPA